MAMSSGKEGKREAAAPEIGLKLFTTSENFLPSYFLKAHLLTAINTFIKTMAGKRYYFKSCPVQLQTIKSTGQLKTSDVRRRLWPAKHNGKCQEKYSIDLESVVSHGKVELIRTSS